MPTHVVTYALEGSQQRTYCPYVAKASRLPYLGEEHRLLPYVRLNSSHRLISFQVLHEVVIFPELPWRVQMILSSKVRLPSSSLCLSPFTSSSLFPSLLVSTSVTATVPHLLSHSLTLTSSVFSSRVWGGHWPAVSRPWGLHPQYVWLQQYVPGRCHWGHQTGHVRWWGTGGEFRGQDNEWVQSHRSIDNLKFCFCNDVCTNSQKPSNMGITDWHYCLQLLRGEKQTSGFWTFEYYQSFFNVDTMQVQYAWNNSLICTHEAGLYVAV